MSYRIGYGEDIHALVEGRPLFLCGVEIPFEKGLLGVSDADVGLHALADALLGSLALGDIGQIYPPSDPKSQGLSSDVIVKEALRRVKEKGYKVVNADICIGAEAPKLIPHLKAMREKVAGLLEVTAEDVSIKGKTAEKFGAVGEGKAMRATAVVLVEKA